MKRLANFYSYITLEFPEERVTSGLELAEKIEAGLYKYYPPHLVRWSSSGSARDNRFHLRFDVTPDSADVETSPEKFLKEVADTSKRILLKIFPELMSRDVDVQLVLNGEEIYTSPGWLGELPPWGTEVNATMGRLTTSKVSRVQKVTLNIPLLEGVEAEELLKGITKEVTLLDGQLEDVIDNPAEDSTFITISIPTYDFPYLRSNLRTLLEMKWKMGEFDWDLELHKKKPRRKKADALPEPDITMAYRWWSKYFKKLVAKLLSPEAVIAWMENEGLEYDTEDPALSGKSRSFKHFNPHPEDVVSLTGTFAEELFRDFAPLLPDLAQELTSSFEQEVLRELPHWALNFRDNIRLSLESKGYSPGEVNQVLQEAMNQVAIRAALASGHSSYSLVDKMSQYFEWLYDAGIHWDDIYDQRAMEENLRNWEENAVEITHDTLIDELEDYLKQNWWSKYHDKYHPYVRDI